MQLAATRRTAAASRFMPALLPRQMTGQWPAATFLPGIGCWRRRRCGAWLRLQCGDLFLDRLQAQRQLIGMALLRGAAEALPFQRREEQPQLLDLAVPVGQSC